MSICCDSPILHSTKIVRLRLCPTSTGVGASPSEPRTLYRPVQWLLSYKVSLIDLNPFSRVAILVGSIFGQYLREIDGQLFVIITFRFRSRCVCYILFLVNVLTHAIHSVMSLYDSQLAD